MLIVGVLKTAQLQRLYVKVHCTVAQQQNLPGYVLLTASMKFSSNPATIAPPTGTRKFLSVLWIKASTRPIRAACNTKQKSDTVYQHLACEHALAGWSWLQQVFNLRSHSFAELICETSSWTREEKFHSWKGWEGETCSREWTGERGRGRGEQGRGFGWGMGRLPSSLFFLPCFSSPVPQLERLFTG